MGFFDALLGGKRKLKAPAPDRLFAMATAQLALEMEIGLKHRNVAGIVFQPIATGDFDPMPVTSEHAALVEHLPWHHRDPFDRLLVAQASHEDHVLVSADARMTAYDVEVVW